MARFRNAPFRRVVLTAIVPLFAAAIAIGWLLAPEPATAGPPAFCPQNLPLQYWNFNVGEGSGPTRGSACSAAQADAIATASCSVCAQIGSCGVACAVGGGCTAHYDMRYVCWLDF